jgi:hypothetical protein
MMVTTYSRCDLTVPSDHIIAISGIAKRFEEMYDEDEFFDGVWKKGLHIDLMWESNAFEEACVVRSGAFAPSWSWASVRGGSVTVPRAHQNYSPEPSSLIRLISARIRRQGGNGDSKAPLQNSELEIECVVHHFKRDAKSKMIEIFEDETFSRPIRNMQESGQDTLRLDTEALVQNFNQNEDITGVCIRVQEGHETHGHRAVRYLLLEPVSIPTSGYKRLGTAVSRGFGLIWDISKPTHITLV